MLDVFNLCRGESQFNPKKLIFPTQSATDIYYCQWPQMKKWPNKGNFYWLFLCYLLKELLHLMKLLKCVFKEPLGGNSKVRAHQTKIIFFLICHGAMCGNL